MGREKPVILLIHLTRILIWIHLEPQKNTCLLGPIIPSDPRGTEPKPRVWLDYFFIGLSLFLAPQLLAEFNFSPQLQNRMFFTLNYQNRSLLAPGERTRRFFLFLFYG
jgi:hypothetical protein